MATQISRYDTANMNRFLGNFNVETVDTTNETTTLYGNPTQNQGAGYYQPAWNGTSWFESETAQEREARELANPVSAPLSGFEVASNFENIDGSNQTELIVDGNKYTLDIALKLTTNANIPTDSKLGTLPFAYRPSKNINVGGADLATGQPVLIVINSNTGVVTVKHNNLAITQVVGQVIYNV